MTLSAIKSMFARGAYWKVEYSHPESICRLRPFRQVHQAGGTDLVWSIGSLDKLYTRWPKAPEIIAAAPGRLEFRYEGQSQTFTFTLLTTPEEIQQAASHIDACAKADAEQRAAKEKESAETKARLDAEFRKARDDKFRNLQPVTAYELIDALREHEIHVSPGTIGAMRKKEIHKITKDGYSFIARKRPRFSYETQPSVLYMKVHDSLLLQDLAEPIEDTAPDPELDRLFGIQPDAPANPAALDLFAA